MTILTRPPFDARTEKLALPQLPLGPRDRPWPSLRRHTIPQRLTACSFVQRTAITWLKRRADPLRFRLWKLQHRGTAPSEALALRLLYELFQRVH